MAVTIWENADSRGGNSQNLQREYFAYVGSGDDEEDLITALDSYAPSTLAGLPRQDYEIEELDTSIGLWRASMKYGSGSSGSIPDLGSWEYRFNFQAPSAHIYQSLSTISVTGDTDNDFSGAINVVKDASGQRVEGYNLAPPTVTFTIGYYPASGSFSTSYQNTIRGLVGKVNNATYKDCPAGSLMLASASGGMRSSEQASLEFGFAYIENATSIPVGDLTVSAKDGFDLLWAYYEDGENGDSLIKSPTTAFVERIYYRTSFGGLGV
jgi:hypothetical protein